MRQLRSNNISAALLARLLLPVAFVAALASAFEWSSGGKHPEVDRLALAGLWKLTPRIVPMKEFTVYPKRPASQQDKPPELLLMLKEDGSFQQYNNDDNGVDEEEEGKLDVDASWTKFRSKKPQQLGGDVETLELTKGTWDFVDGKLILAADRPETETVKPRSSSSGSSKSSSVSVSQEDRLLVGRVVATYETPLDGNPVLQRTSSYNHTRLAGVETTPPSASSPANVKAPPVAVDAHLSVPRGSLKIGRFLYPKHHPSFFEQPMFQPTVRRQAFSLQQVLGNLNARSRAEKEAEVEKYRPSDFYNRTFFLTSHPLPPRKPKGSTRWSIKQGKFIDAPPPSTSKSKQQEEEDDEAAVPIRVLKVAFHKNHTFSTLAGLGESTVLRGKWDVIGSDKDQLWMQVWRFGFGRSVSGSTYSEGRSLTHEDAKCYWGTIRPEGEFDGSNTGGADGTGRPEAAASPVAEGGSSGGGSDHMPPLRLEVRGSVMFGWGLEPLPVARFIMREATQLEEEAAALDEDEDDQDDDSEILEKLENQDSDKRPAADGIDWSDEAFQ